MSYDFVVIFAEHSYDATALEHLLRYLVPNVGIVRKPREPLVLIKGRLPPKVRGSAERVAQAVEREAKLKRRAVDLVIAHEDCDAVEPHHAVLAMRIEEALRKAGLARSVAAVPAWELEAWWYLWPDAVAAVCGSWRRLKRRGNIGLVCNVKEELKKDLRPLPRDFRVPDYSPPDSERIAEQVRRRGQLPDSRVQSASFDLFRSSLSVF